MTALARWIARTVPARTHAFGAQLLGVASIAGVQWMAMLILARRGGPEAVGVMGLAQAIVASVYAGLTLHLKENRATDPVARQPLRAYLRVRVLASALALMVCIPAAAVIAPTRAVVAVTAALALSKALEALSDLLHGELLRRGEIAHVGLRVTGRSLLTFPLILLAVLRFESALAYALGGLAAMIVFVAAFEWPLLRRNLEAQAPTRDDVAAVVRQGVWPAANLILVTAYTAIPRAMLETHGGIAAVGVLVVATQLSVPFTLIASALGQMNAVAVGRAFSAGDRDALWRIVRRLHLQVLGVGAVATVAIWVLAPRLLALLYGPEFVGGTNALRLLTIASSVTVVGNQSALVLVVARRLRAGFVTHVVGVLSLWLLLRTLIPANGLDGAVVAMTVVQVALSVAFFALARQVVQGVGPRPDAPDATVAVA